MSTRHLVDRELLPFIDNAPPLVLSKKTLPQMRATIESAAVLGDPSSVGVLREEHYLPGLNGGPDIRCLVYRPQGKLDGAPGYIHLHGGGFIAGLPEISDRRSTRIAAELGAVVVSVDYRLAPEHPHPAALDDAYAALAWLHGEAGTLGVDPHRIAIGGESAGGGLAAALALKARDDGTYPIVFQLLVYPMLDDRTGASGAPGTPGDPMLGEFVWPREKKPVRLVGLSRRQPCDGLRRAGTCRERGGTAADLDLCGIARSVPRRRPCFRPPVARRRGPHRIADLPFRLSWLWSGG